MWALKVKEIPRMTYELVLEQGTLGKLTEIYQFIRSYVGKWFFLTHHCCKIYDYTMIINGGLGIRVATEPDGPLT